MPFVPDIFSIKDNKSSDLVFVCLCVIFVTPDLGVDHVVLGAEELRHAATDLGRITGRVDVEEVLDVVFREFCIGK